MATITKGQQVTFDCSSFLDDGACLDDPADTDPFIMKAGATKKLNDLPGAISNALVGMTLGESKHLKIPPQFAFGERDPSKVFSLSMKKDNSYEIGQAIQLKITDKHGEKIKEGTVIEIKGDHADVDTNHPLAGKTVLVKIKILSIN